MAATEIQTGPDRTQRLAAALAGLRPEHLSAAVLDRTADLVLDVLGVSIHGLSLPWSKIIADYAEDDGGKPQAVLFGRGRVPARVAALGNGTMAHGIELDDTHDQSCTHPGAVVIPAALAVAELTGASGNDFLTAVVAGYEAQTRAGAALTGDLMTRGFHPTALSGVFGATTAAAHLMKLDAAQLQCAWGLGVSMASGVMQFTQDAQGTMVKRLHAGFPSHNGVMAAQLAARGFRGPRGALDGKAGFVHVFSPNPEDWRLDDGLGEKWAVEDISVKFYACCRLFHALVDAINETRDGSWRPEDLSAVHAFGPRMMSDGHMQYRPQSVMSAQYSLPYSIAVALKLDPRDPRSFNSTAMQRQEVLSIGDLVTASIDDELERAFPAKYAGGVRFALKDGRTIEKTLLDSFGTPAKPVNRAGIEGKFRALTNGIVTEQRQAEIVAATRELRDGLPVAALAALLTEGVAALAPADAAEPEAA